MLSCAKTTCSEPRNYSVSFLVVAFEMPRKLVGASISKQLGAWYASFVQPKRMIDQPLKELAE